MADPFTEYQKVLASRGLGGVFQEEGPGMGPSSKTSAQIKALRQLRDGSISSGMDERIATPQMNRGILEALQSEQRSRNVAPNDIESAINEVRGLNLASILGTGLGNTSRTGSPMTLQEKKARKNLRDAAASRIEEMPEDSSIFKDSSFFDIASQLGKAQINPSLNGANDSEIAQRMIADKNRLAADLASAEKFGAEEAAAVKVDAVIDDKMNKDAIAGLLGDSGSADKNVAVEDAFLGGMSEYYKALSQEVPEVGDRKELLKKYMQEFSEATGIPVGGKVDKSQALMAMGLSLMQNRAGKGFNVGKLLNAVGQAGDAAMPYLTKAKDEAKQARIAAGKYALQQIESDENAATAVKTANRALYQDLALENLKHENEMKQKILEAELEGNETGKVEALKSVGDLKIRIGSQDLILKRGANIEDEGRVVWQDPVGDSKNIATAYRKTTGGLNSINRMSELLNLMSSDAEGKLGGTAAQGLFDKAKEVARSIGMDLGPYTGGEDVAPRVQYEKLSNALLANFKRYLTSETGNGISTYDVQQIEKALGKFGTFDDISGAKMALEEILPMFTHSLTVLEPLVEDFSDRKQYRRGVAGDEQYNDVMNFLSTEFGQTNLINPVQTTREDGTVVIEYDVSY